MANPMVMEHLRFLYTKAELNTLVQKQVSAALKNHTANNLSQQNNNNKGGKQKNKAKGSNGDTKKKPCIPKQAWKALPPPPGTFESKEVDGKIWHWCASCGFCHLSHGTADHKDPSNFHL